MTEKELGDLIAANAKIKKTAEKIYVACIPRMIDAFAAEEDKNKVDSVCRQLAGLTLAVSAIFHAEASGAELRMIEKKEKEISCGT